MNQNNDARDSTVSDLSYVYVTPEKAVESGVLDPETAVEPLRSEYFGYLKTYRQSAEYRETIHDRLVSVNRKTGVRMVELAYIAEVASVDTLTDEWESLMRDYLRGNISRDELLTQTRDGEIKREKVSHVLSSEIPEKVYDNLIAFDDPELTEAVGNVTRAREWLTGLHSGDENDTYARATKSAFVTWMLGFDTLCMDRRIHRSLKPIFEAVMADYPVRPDNIVNPSGRTVRMDMDKRVPSTVEFVHDSLKWQVDEMNEYASVAIDYVARQTEIPRDRIAQVAFNVGGDGETTIHRDVMRVLAGTKID